MVTLDAADFDRVKAMEVAFVLEVLVLPCTGFQMISRVVIEPTITIGSLRLAVWLFFSQIYSKSSFT
jgi:hypothetical protein